MSKQEEIKQALAAATPGPWAIYKTTVGRHEETLIGTAYDHPQLKAPDSIVGHAYGLDGQHVYIREADAELISKAPEYIAYLLEENERLRKELEEARKVARIYHKATSDIHNTLRWGDSENALERVETIIELAQLQEGEGNQ